MGTNIGELFVKLGFDVDDTKLKSFDNSIKDVFGTVVRFGTTLAGVGTFYELAKGAENNAIALRNLNTELGVNMQWAQGFAALWKMVNPTADINKGIEISRNMANYASAMKYSGGAEYGLFGGTAEDGVDPTTAPEKMLARLRAGLPGVLSLFNGDKAKVSQLLQTITGSPDMINVLNASPEQISSAMKLRNLNNDSIAETEKAAENISTLQTRWDNFVNHAAAALAYGANSLADGTAKSSFLDDLKKRWALPYHGFHFGGDDPLITTYTNDDSLPYVDGGAGEGVLVDGKLTSLGTRSHNPGNLQPNGIEAQFADDAAGLAAMVNNLHKYGSRGWNSIDSIVDHWSPAGGKGNSPATAAAYKMALQKALGVGVDQHLDLNNPDTLERLLPAMIKQEQGFNSFSASQIAAAAGDTTNNVTINVQTNADPAHVAELVHKRFIDVTYSTVNKGGY